MKAISAQKLELYLPLSPVSLSPGSLKKAEVVTDHPPKKQLPLLAGEA